MYHSLEDGVGMKFYNSRAWRNKRLEIIERDNRECQRCKELGKLTISEDNILEVHHIEHLKDRPDLALDDDNLITLCISCHNHYHDRYNNVKANKIGEDIPEKW